MRKGRALFLALTSVALTLSLVGCSSQGEPDEVTIQTADNALTVSLEVECRSNLFFSRYDIAFYVDEELQEVIDHGATKQYEIDLSEGDHVLRFAKEGDNEVDGSVEITVNDNMALKCVLGCTSSQVEVQMVESIFPPIASDEAVSMSHDDVREAFEQAGFTEIREEELRDLALDQADHNWLVGSISIDGDDSFDKESSFLADDEVLISYHVLGDINPPASASELVGQDYEKVAEQFASAGFSNVKTEPAASAGTVGAVSQVTIGGFFGSSDFVRGDSFPFDEQVTIQYYEEDPDAETPNANANANAEVEEVLTIDSSPDLASLLSSGETNASWFSTSYRGKTIQFDGHVASLMTHGDYSTRWDVLILAGNNGASPSLGPNFKLINVSFYDMNVTNADTLREGQNITVTAVVGDYDSATDWLELDPVSISIR
ncbi:DUF4839 domain-containing protein [Collinsella sp. An307]|uniref:DUF4839 domain-containing protein n=1 Tax=Collinsella sp. An307 TaxID=1965630 RepID=UPI00117C02F2|nr:DUF4839 domain-containing protein [Collinsella sp. An307]